MTSRRYKWQTRWRIDAGAMLAVHDSGLLVPFTLAGVALAPTNLEAVAAQLLPKNGPHNTPQMLRRLEREARQLIGEHCNANR